MKKFFMILMLLLMNDVAALAEPMAEADIPARYTSWTIEYDINPDGSFVESQKWSTLILKENALERMKESSVNFSTSVAKGEILEAYTLKKSGKRLDVAKSSYQVTTNDGYGGNSPLYSDETTISVVYPDLAVGDTTVFSYRVTNSEGMFPGHFSVAHRFSRFYAYDDVKIRIVAPKQMKLQTDSYFVKALPPVEKDGKQILEWTYQNRQPDKWTPADAGIYAVGEEPSLYVSTYDSYRQIADAYGLRANPKAAVSDRITALAKEIVPEKATPEAEARAIYNWVAKNISYGGNCIGIGAVVPRDLGIVIENKMGDCKDHATLFQALLAARGIKSEQALVNAGSLYDLPKVPVVSAVNHVINYVPSLNLYLDSTASYVPFGMVPMELGDKPVLHVTKFVEGAKIPSTAPYGHEQVLKTTVKVKPDGSAEGMAEVKLKGLPAIQMRSLMRNLRGDQEELVARGLIESQGFHGTAKLDKDDPKELLDEYGYRVSFKIDDLIVAGGPTGMVVRPVVGTPYAVAMFLKQAYEPAAKKPAACGGGRSVEEFTIEFPDELKVVASPKDVTITSSAIEYKATYRREGNVFTGRRDLNDKTKNNVCSVAYMEEYKKSARSITQDLRAQVLISN